MHSEIKPNVKEVKPAEKPAIEVPEVKQPDKKVVEIPGKVVTVEPKIENVKD